MKLVLNVVAMLLAFVSIVALINGLIGWVVPDLNAAEDLRLGAGAGGLV